MYVIQTKAGCELSAGELLRRKGFNVKIPEKLMYIRRGGLWKLERHLIFTRYIFLDIDDVKPESYYRIKNSDGVINFIGCGNPQSMYECEIGYINWLWNNGKPIEPSTVFVTSDGNKMIMSGPLKKYSDEYVDYNVRQRRAKVKIPICGVYKNVTLPIEIIKKTL